MKKLIFSVVLLFASVLCARAQEEVLGECRYSDAPRLLNLPQTGVVLPIPPGFLLQLPLEEGREVLLEIEEGDEGAIEQYFYYMNASYFDPMQFTSGAAFRFGENDTDEMLELRVISQVSFPITKDELVKQVPKDAKKLSSLKTGCGTTVSCAITESGVKRDWHVVVTDDYVYAFKMRSDLPKKTKAQYEAIISSLTERESPVQLEAYEEKVASGYFGEYEEYEESEEYIGYDDSEEDIFSVVMNGTFDQNTRVVWDPSLYGVTAEFPAGWQYQFSCVDASWESANELVVLGAPGDEYHPGYNFMGENLSLNLQVNTVGAVYYDGEQESLQGIKYVEQQEGLIDGIPTKIIYFGSHAYGTVAMYWTIDDNSYQLIAEGVTRETLPELNAILAQVKITANSEERVDAQTTVLSFSLTDDPAASTLDKTPIKLSSIDMKNTSEWQVPDLAIAFRLPGDSSHYQLSSQESGYVEMESTQITELPEYDGEVIYLSSEKQPVTLVITRQEKPLDLLKYTQKQKASKEMYSSNVILRAAVETINNITWSEVLVYDRNVSGYEAMMTTYKDGYKLQFSVKGYYSEQQLMDYVSFIKEFRLMNP